MRPASLRRSLTWLVAGMLPGLLLNATSAADNWPQFRGENGSGVSPETGFSTKWSADRIAWNVELPGVGHSSPVIWGDKLFLTSASEQGTSRILICRDAKTGTPLWTREMEFRASKKHPKNSWASSTPAVDGQRVYAVFADAARQVLYCYDFAGKLVWQQVIGAFESQHGQGASPIVFEDLVILVNDQDGPSSIVAFNKQTAETVWKVSRNSGPQATSYATPFIYEPKNGPAQLICSSGPSGLSGLEARTGRTIWTTRSLPARVVGSPLLADGLVLQCTGGGGQGILMVAVDPNGHGDVSATHIRYERKQLLPYVPTPVAYEHHVFLWSDHGVVCCVDPVTGNDVWKKRLGGDWSASPICAGGMMFNIDESGDVTVLAAGPEFKLLGKFPLGDQSRSTPAIAGGRIYFRTFHRLACVQARS
jgi:outer membrane protein assembly factor BamB